MTGIAVGTASGLVTDALIRKRTLLYVAPSQCFSAGDRLAPMLAKAVLPGVATAVQERTGVSISIRF